MSAFDLVLQEKVKGNILAVQRMVSRKKKYPYPFLLTNISLVWFHENK